MTNTLSQLLTSDRVICDYLSRSKSAVILKICQLFKQSIVDIDESSIFNHFIERERLGSTAIGHGIAIPHIRSDEVKHTHASLIKLEKPVDFGAYDQKPVDIVIGLLVPSEQNQNHLTTLANIATQFSSNTYCNLLRSTSNDNQLIESILCHDETLSA